MTAESPSFVAGGGDLGERIRAFDWSATPLGRLSEWPQSLRTAVRIMLTSRQPIWIGWGKELIYLYNDPYKSIIGGKHPWALGRPTQEVWREIWPDIAPMLATAMGGDEGTYVESQLLIMERSGYPEETYYTFSYSPIPDDQGRPGGIICANTDDTQRVLGERQLALLRELAAAGSESRTLPQVYEKTTRALATNQRDVPFTLIYFADPDGKTLSLVGWTPLGPLHSAFPKQIAISESSPWPLAEVIDTQAVRVVGNLETRFGESFPSGAWHKSPHHAALIPIPARGETGRHGVLVVGLNPFRQFDDAYRSFLTLAAGEIAAGFANAQAYDDERRRAEALAEIDRAKTLFFSNVSHEFRTPLTLMMSPLEEVLSKSAGEVLPDNRALIDVAYRNSRRLHKLVNSLLDFSRIEAGRAQATYEATDLATYTGELASNFRSACERAGLRLVIDCPPLAEPAYIDRDMWEKIVLNLLSNAFKFTFEGEIAVRLREVDGKAELTVSDTGVGIPAHEVPRLFERFHRIEGQKSRTYEGSGIGLALVQELIKFHKGAISVDSSVGRGTIFTVTIPLGRSHLPADRIGGERTMAPTAIRADAFVEEALRWLPADDKHTTQQAAQGIVGTQTSEGGRILLADDNADMRGYIDRLLAPHFEVQAVADGQAAIDAVRERKPDLVLADVMMPRLDGLGLVRELRTTPSLADLPVILVSARADEQARLAVC
jgi:signal transduction histidine kinase/CheY-like chemotaxis protein